MSTHNRKIDLTGVMKEIRRRKRKIRKAKDEASEIKFLNIVAMVDVLTILLIFLLKSVSISNQLAPTAANLNLPFSTTRTSPVEAVKVFITRDKIIVQDEPVAELNKGSVPDLELAQDDPLLIPDLQKALTNWIRHTAVATGGEENQFNLEILADKETPYHLLMQIFYTAGQAEVTVESHTFAFSKYRLLVMRGGG